MDGDKARWTRLVAGWESSDLTQREYAQECGVSVHALRYWLYRLRKESRPLVAVACESSETVAAPAETKEDLHLVPVRAVGCAPKARRRDEAEVERLELAFPSGARLRFPAGTDLDYLRALAAALAP